MTGIKLLQAPRDWEILQHTEGYASIHLKGSFSIPESAINVGTAFAHPVVRIVREKDNSPVIPWTKAVFTLEDEFSFRGSFYCDLKVPAGGLYRIETGVDAASTDGQYAWVFRGDVRFHIGVGNLFVIGGQSNAAGFGEGSAGDAPSMDVHLLRNNGCWDMAAHPLNESTDAPEDNANTELRVTGTSPFLAFGRTLTELSGMPVGLIPCAKGGSDMNMWNPQNGCLYSNMLRKVDQLNTVPAGILWYQGCSDTFPDLMNNYEEKFQNMISKIRKEWRTEIPFFLYQLNIETDCTNDEGWGIVREAQRQTALKLPSVYILPTLGSSQSDNIHNDSISNLSLGEKMGRLCTQILFPELHMLEIPDMQAPDITSALIKENVLYLTFHHAEGGFCMRTSSPDLCGFFVSDRLGEIPMDKILNGKPGTLSITLKRPAEGDVFISFCHYASLSALPPLEQFTGLPPLAFYKYPL